MMKEARQAQILRLLDECEELPLGEIARRLGRISEVTVRRDVVALAREGKLERSRGSASRLEATHAPTSNALSSDEVLIGIESVDALVLPPIEGRGADTLRMLARRRRIPFLAESSPQDFGTYLGPDNFAVGRDLGNRAGRWLNGVIKTASLLVISIEQLPNTRARCDGFERGFAETFRSVVQKRRIDCRGSYRLAFEGASDSMQVHSDINVVFGVNDHAILAGIDAAERLGLKVSGYGIGGEGNKLFEVLAADNALRACGVLFPEVVGFLAIDVLSDTLQGRALPEVISTPHVVLTSHTLPSYYQRGNDGNWTLTAEAVQKLMPGVVESPKRLSGTRTYSIGFAPHYPAHEWYRGIERAMRSRCAQLGIELRVGAPQAGIAREINVLRRLIAKRAVGQICPGETVLVNAGPLSDLVAAELMTARDVTVVTNSLDVLQLLAGNRELKVILTGGELHPRFRCLVGPSLGSLFETLRPDKAILSVDGITPRFGPSSSDERLALAARRFVDAARSAVVLADHSLVGVDATHRICSLERIGQLITDTGSLPRDRLAISQSGTLLTLADADSLGGAYQTQDMNC